MSVSFSRFLNSVTAACQRSSGIISNGHRLTSLQSYPQYTSRHFSVSSSSTGSKGDVVLLYSGGLDTSTVLVWLREQGYNVHAYCANLGQEEDFEAAKAKALKIGAKSVHVEDLREEFLKTYILPAIQANAIYENLYLMGTSLARPCIAKRAVEIAHKMKCKFVAHGATGKGNDQVRFELTFAALDPTLQAIVPWRDPAFYNKFQGRPDLLDYAAKHGVPVVQTKAKPYSMDENMMHISYEAGILEDPSNPAPEDMFRMTVDPAKAPNTAAVLKLTFEKGLPVRVQNAADGTDISGDVLKLYLYLNKIGGEHGVGRQDVVENRFVGIKSRGVYENPGAEILRQGHIGLEGLTLDREVFRLRDTLSARFSDCVYNGFWYSPEMEFILAAIEKSQERVTGSCDVKLFKGRASILSRSSPLSLYSKKISSMDESGGWDPRDSTGFIKINSVRLRAHAAREASIKKN
jgi:argininosuccinate synthase